LGKEKKKFFGKLHAERGGKKGQVGAALSKGLKRNDKKPQESRGEGWDAKKEIF